jgi:protein-tyrosine phosphatase
MSRTTKNGLIPRVPAALLLAAGTLLAGSGVAVAEPAVPPALAGLLDTASSAGSVAPVADAPRLATVDNFRDVAGTGAGYATPRGTVHKGVFYRSNAIVPNDADLATLSAVGLTTAYDLRGPDEIAQKADRLPAGVAYVNIPILAGNVNELVARIHSPEDARQEMRKMNRDFVTGAVERAGFAQLLTSLAETDGAQVFHCTAGKDRTGWTSYLLLTIAGVDAQTIMDDYLLTNEYTAESMAKTLAYLRQTQGDAVAENFGPLVGVEASYLQAGIDQLTADFGTVDNYLTTGLGLSTGTIGALKAKLVG